MLRHTRTLLALAAVVLLAGSLASEPTIAMATPALEGVPVHEFAPGGPGGTKTLSTQLSSTAGPVWFWDGFESGSVGANWTVLDSYTWGVSSAVAASGSYSAWCLGNNSYRPYPNDYRARMRRGPYDLSGSTGQTVLRADLWVESEFEFDYAKMLVSTDGANYYGLGWSGNAAFWRTKALDLTNVYTLGDVSKSPNLYVMLAFQSDESESEGNGVYFDNVRLEDLGNPQPDLVSNSLSGSSSGPAGSALPITDTIANQGSAEASAAQASYYLSSDANITSSDIYLGSRAVSSLPAGGTDSATTTFTVPAGTSGTYYVGTIVDSSDNVSESLEDNNARAGNTVAIPAVTFLTGQISPRSPGHRSPIAITARLSAGSVSGPGLAGRVVELRSSPTGTGSWTSHGNAITDTGGTAAWPISAPESARYYGVFFAGVPSEYVSSNASLGRVVPKVNVRTPVAPSKMSRRKYYTISGYLMPKHAAGSKPVRIYKYRRVGGAWKPYGYVSAKVSSYPTYSKYAASMKLKYAGKWRLRAYAPADSDHAATWSSGYDYVTVK